MKHFTNWLYKRSAKTILAVNFMLKMVFSLQIFVIAAVIFMMVLSIFFPGAKEQLALPIALLIPVLAILCLIIVAVHPFQCHIEEGEIFVMPCGGEKLVIMYGPDTLLLPRANGGEIMRKRHGMHLRFCYFTGAEYAEVVLFLILEVDPEALTVKNYNLTAGTAIRRQFTEEIALQYYKNMGRDAIIAVNPIFGLKSCKVCFDYSYLVYISETAQHSQETPVIRVGCLPDGIEKLPVEAEPMMDDPYDGEDYEAGFGFEEA